MCVVDADMMWVRLSVPPRENYGITVCVWVTGEGANYNGGSKMGGTDWQNEDLDWDHSLCACCCGDLLRKLKVGVW